MKRKPRVLIFIVAYNAEKTIEKVLTRIPDTLRQYDTEILIIDDASADETFKTAVQARLRGLVPYKLTVLQNPVNQMYGGNQKIGFHYAVEKGFDVVALVHGDGQYAPEALPTLLEPLIEGKADAVFGSRMMTLTGALAGGMPMYKYVGNRILTFFQNTMLGSRLSEFHSGYRLYTTNALSRIPFHLNTNDFHFDTEIIIQLLLAGQRIKELPIPTYYGDEICHVNGLKYAWDVTKATTVARLQKFCLFYRRNFDVQDDASNNWFYKPKLDFTSPHSEALKEIAPNSRVLDLGCASGYLFNPLKAKGCHVTGIDKYQPAANVKFDKFIEHDLDTEDFDLPVGDLDYVLLLDVIEHLSNPERFATALSAALAANRKVQIIISSANIAFAIPRLMHLIGQFNYGKKGILDLTHTRLFTFASLQRLFEESGFAVIASKGIPVPFPLVVSNRGLAGFLVSFNEFLIKLSRTLFSYQIYMVLKSTPTLKSLLQDAYNHSMPQLDSLEKTFSCAPEDVASAPPTYIDVR